MGLVVGIFLTALVISGIYKFLQYPNSRSEFVAEFRKTPFKLVFIMAQVGFIMLFFWGLLAPVFGKIEVDVFHENLQLWEIGGIGSLILWVASWFLKID
jgi:hypothetical protein